MKFFLLIIFFFNISTIFAGTTFDSLEKCILGSWETKSEKFSNDVIRVSNFYKVAPNIILEENFYEKKDNDYFSMENRSFWVFDREYDLFYILKSTPSENLQFLMRFDEKNKTCYFFRFSSQNYEDLKKVHRGEFVWDAISSRIILELKFDEEQIRVKFEKYIVGMGLGLRFPDSKIVKTSENKSFSKKNFSRYFNEQIATLFENPVLKVLRKDDLEARTHVSGNYAFLIFYKGKDVVNFPSIDSKPISNGFNFTVNSFHIALMEASDPVFVTVEKRDNYHHIISINDTPLIFWKKFSWGIENSMSLEDREFVGIKEGDFWIFYSTKEAHSFFDLVNRDYDTGRIISLKDGLIPYFKVNFSNKELDIIPLK